LEGFHLALLERHLPHRLMRDIDLAQGVVGSPKVLVLPNLMLMSPEACEAVRRFVAAGGGLVATFRTSLCDEDGNPRDNFALADVFGADYMEMFGFSYGFVRFDEAHEITRNIKLGFPMTLWEKHQTKVRPRNGAQALGRLVNPMRGMHMGNPPQEVTPWPALVLNTFGKGRVVYMPQQMGDCYQDYGHPDNRALLADAVRWAAGGPPPVELEGPATVEMVPWGQGGGKRIVHLVNRTSAGPMRTKGSVITECIPVHNLKLVFADRLRHARLEPDGLALEVRPCGVHWETTVPRLDIHGMVIVE
jgi:hypothetical protein